MVSLVERELVNQVPLVLERWVEVVGIVVDDSRPVLQGTLVEGLAVCCTWALCWIGSIAVRCGLISVLSLLANHVASTCHGNLCQECVSITLGCALCGIACCLVCPWQVFDSLIQVVHQGIHNHVAVGLLQVSVAQVSL